MVHFGAKTFNRPDRETCRPRTVTSTIHPSPIDTMSAAMNKENLINQLPSSPYTPTQKVRSRKNSQITPIYSPANWFISCIRGSRSPPLRRTTLPSSRCPFLCASCLVWLPRLSDLQLITINPTAILEGFASGSARCHPERNQAAAEDPCSEEEARQHHARYLQDHTLGPLSRALSHFTFDRSFARGREHHQRHDGAGSRV